MHLWDKLDSTKTAPAVYFPSLPELTILHPFISSCFLVQCIFSNPMTPYLKWLSSWMGKLVPLTVFSILTFHVSIVVTLLAWESAFPVHFYQLPSLLLALREKHLLLCTWDMEVLGLYQILWLKPKCFCWICPYFVSWSELMRTIEKISSFLCGSL